MMKLFWLLYEFDSCHWRFVYLFLFVLIVKRFVTATLKASIWIQVLNWIHILCHHIFLLSLVHDYTLLLVSLIMKVTLLIACIGNRLAYSYDIFVYIETYTSKIKLTENDWKKYESVTLQPLTVLWIYQLAAQLLICHSHGQSLILTCKNRSQIMDRWQRWLRLPDLNKKKTLLLGIGEGGRGSLTRGGAFLG